MSTHTDWFDLLIGGVILYMRLAPFLERSSEVRQAKGLPLSWQRCPEQALSVGLSSRNRVYALKDRFFYGIEASIWIQSHITQTRRDPGRSGHEESSGIHLACGVVAFTRSETGS